MELIIVLIVMIVASAFVYLQLKGSKPVVSVVELTASAQASKKKSPKKNPQMERKIEQWDKPEPVAKRSVEEGDKKKKKKEAFDPVAEGVKVLKSTYVEEKVQTDVHINQRKKNKLAADGFVVVEEKKVQRRTIIEEIEEPESSPINDRVQMLNAIVNKQSQPKKDWTPNPTSESKPKPTRSEGITQDELAARIAKGKGETLAKRKGTDTRGSNMGGKVLTYSVPATGRSWAPVAKVEADADADADAEVDAEKPSWEETETPEVGEE